MNERLHNEVVRETCADVIGANVFDGESVTSVAPLGAAQVPNFSAVRRQLLKSHRTELKRYRKTLLREVDELRAKLRLLSRLTRTEERLAEKISELCGERKGSSVLNDAIERHFARAPSELSEGSRELIVRGLRQATQKQHARVGDTSRDAISQIDRVRSFVQSGVAKGVWNDSFDRELLSSLSSFHKLLLPLRDGAFLAAFPSSQFDFCYRISICQHLHARF